MQSDQIRPWIPFLRRLARATTGGVDSDVAVRVCVERLLREPLDPQGERPRVFRELVLALQSLQVARKDIGPQRAHSIVARLARLPLRQRLALLLTELEGLPVAEVAEILELPPARVHAIIKRATERLSSPQRSARVLVIEDEPCVALDLEQVVERNGHSVIGIAATESEAMSIAAGAPPQLILADVQLAGRGSGVDAVRAIAADADVPAIYITAYPERVSLSDACSSTYLMRKPFDRAQLASLISKALALTPARFG